MVRFCYCLLMWMCTKACGRSCPYVWMRFRRGTLLTLSEPVCGICKAPYERSVGKFGEFFRCPRYQRRCRKAATLSLGVYRREREEHAVPSTPEHAQPEPATEPVRAEPELKRKLSTVLDAESKPVESPQPDLDKKPRTHSHHTHTHTCSYAHTHMRMPHYTHTHTRHTQTLQEFVLLAIPISVTSLLPPAP